MYFKLKKDKTVLLWHLFSCTRMFDNLHVHLKLDIPYYQMCICLFKLFGKGEFTAFEFIKPLLFALNNDPVYYYDSSRRKFIIYKIIVSEIYLYLCKCYINSVYIY